MAALQQHQSQLRTKLLLLGNSGAGKTRALATLANAGYRLMIWDYDNGLDVLTGKDSEGRSVVSESARANVFFETLTDAPGKPPSAYTRGLNLFNRWKTASEDLGAPTEWGERDVIVIDSLTLHGVATLNYVLSIAGAMGRPPQLQHWGEAMRLQEQLLQILWSETIRCNVVITAHVTFIGGEESQGIIRGYPSALGSKLPPKVGRYFNSVLMIEALHNKRVLRTSTRGNIDLKTPVANIPAEMEPDLAKYFSIVQGAAASATPPAPQANPHETSTRT